MNVVCRMAAKGPICCRFECVLGPKMIILSCFSAISYVGVDVIKTGR